MRVADIQRFCMHDGPGIRTTVFLKGCPLSCAWCHNPEAQSGEKELLFYKSKCIGCRFCASCGQGVHSFSKGHEVFYERCIACGECADGCPSGALELCGGDFTAEELYKLADRDRAFYKNGGGVTLSGGEPFLQAEEALAFLKRCKEGGIGTAVETSGYFSAGILPRAVPLVDLFLWDIKDTDDERHKKYTGVSNEKIIKNLRLADSLGAKTRVRCILVRGVNTDSRHYEGVASLVASLKGCEGAELVPYHSFGGAKAEALGKNDPGSDSLIPSEEEISFARSCLLQRGINVF